MTERFTLAEDGLVFGARPRSKIPTITAPVSYVMVMGSPALSRFFKRVTDL